MKRTLEYWIRMIKLYMTLYGDEIQTAIEISLLTIIGMEVIIMLVLVF